jgi:hypothetical protein
VDTNGKEKVAHVIGSCTRIDLYLAVIATPGFALAMHCATALVTVNLIEACPSHLVMDIVMLTGARCTLVNIDGAVGAVIAGSTGALIAVVYNRGCAGVIACGAVLARATTALVDVFLAVGKRKAGHTCAVIVRRRNRGGIS